MTTAEQRGALGGAPQLALRIPLAATLILVQLRAVTDLPLAVPVGATLIIATAACSILTFWRSVTSLQRAAVVAVAAAAELYLTRSGGIEVAIFSGVVMAFALALGQQVVDYFGQPAAERAPDPGQTIIRSVPARELLALLATIAGPMALVRADVPLDVADFVLIALYANIAVATTPDSAWVRRAGVLGWLLATALFINRFLIVRIRFNLCVWLGFGLVLGDWVIRGRPPHPRLRACHLTARWPLLAVIALTWIRINFDLGSPSYGSGAATASLGITLVILAGFRADTWKLAAMVVGLTAITAASVFFTAKYPLLSASVAGVTRTLVMVAFASTGDRPDRPWGLRGRFGPLLLAVPGLLWWMVNLAIWARGHWVSSEWGWLAWKVRYSQLDPHYTDFLAYSAIPLTVLALLGIGAYLAAGGRHAGRRVGQAVVLGLVAAIVVGTMSAAGIRWVTGAWDWVPA